MCGIAGAINFAGSVEEGLLHRMCEVMEHRGPDSRRVHVEAGAGLAIQRLAIIDLIGGDQPIFNEDGSVAVVLNGEIYNYLELRHELAERGHQFSSRSDTEVIVHLYEEVGPELVHRLRGMFAFAIWDRTQRKLVCARDRVGKKPLFWARRGQRFWFASTVASLIQEAQLRREINPVAIDAFLTFQYVPHPLCVFDGIHKLPPATTMEVTATGASIQEYWALDYERKLNASPSELAEGLQTHLREATRLRLMGEVPLGAFLSGGIDSSAVVASMADQMTQPVKTFSIGFSDDAYDETHYARRVASEFDTDHHELIVQPDALSIMPRMARHYGEPFADPSAIPSFYLAELTSRHVTIALNGDGGDESFAGYGRYVKNDLLGRFDRLSPLIAAIDPVTLRLLGHTGREKSLRPLARRLIHALATEPWERYATGMAGWNCERRSQLLSAEFAAEVGDRQAELFIADAWAQSSARERVDRMLDVDVHTYLPGDLLVKMDVATMAYSVEARSPFLDHVLMEFAAAVPSRQKLNRSSGKRLLKLALRGTLPDEILDRPKMGFGVPLARWFRQELRDLPSEWLLDPAALARGYFRRSEIERTLREHQDGFIDHSVRLWTLLQLESWHREIADAPAVSSTIASSHVVRPAVPDSSG
jgi:asparagine synthase (glutamine-hydrolysing)